MNRRQALSACALLFPFAKDASAQSTTTLGGGSNVGWTTIAPPKMILVYDMTKGTITINNKERSVTVSIEEIMDALDPRK